MLNIKHSFSNFVQEHKLLHVKLNLGFYLLALEAKFRIFLIWHLMLAHQAKFCVQKNLTVQGRKKVTLGCIFNFGHLTHKPTLNFKHLPHQNNSETHYCLTHQAKSWIYNIKCSSIPNIWHSRTNFEFSIFAMISHILNVQLWSPLVKSWIFNTCTWLAFSYQSWIFNIWDNRSQIFSIWYPVQILNFQCLAPRSNLEFSIFSIQVKSWIFNIYHPGQILNF